MKRGSTLYLRGAVVVLGLLVLLLCFLILPAVYTHWGVEYPDVADLKYPVLLGLSVTAIAFFVALFQAAKLLSYIDANTAFSDLSIKAIQRIKYCALVIAALYTISLPTAYYMAEVEDAPGLMVIAMLIVFASATIAVFAAVLQRLLQNVITIKAEHDLTV